MDRDTRALTGLRGVAALWVMIHHFASGYDRMPAAHAFVKGYLAVDLFFVLSGFVIAMNHGAAFAAEAPSALCSAFYRRRIARVYPLMMVAALLTIGHRAIVGEALPSPLVGLLNLTMTQTWFAQQTIVGSGWSVSVEVFAYLAFPWIAAFVFRKPPLVVTLVIAAAWACLFWMTTLDPATSFGEVNSEGPLDVYDGGRYPILRCLCGFVAGTCAFRLMGYPRFRSIMSRPGVPEAALAAIALLAWRTDLDLVVAVLFVPLVCALAVPRHAASRLLGCAPATWLGDLSYALYLSHFLVGTIVRDRLAGNLPYPIILMSCMLASLAAAAILHILVERPCHALASGRVSLLTPKPAAA